MGKIEAYGKIALSWPFIRRALELALLSTASSCRCRARTRPTRANRRTGLLPLVVVEFAIRLNLSSFLLTSPTVTPLLQLSACPCKLNCSSSIAMSANGKWQELDALFAHIFLPTRTVFVGKLKNFGPEWTFVELARRVCFERTLRTGVDFGGHYLGVGSDKKSNSNLGLHSYDKFEEWKKELKKRLFEGFCSVLSRRNECPLSAHSLFDQKLLATISAASSKRQKGSYVLRGECKLPTVRSSNPFQ